MAEDIVEQAAARLYGSTPEEFMALRSALARHAKDAGDAAAAKSITGLRKPTLAASVVNRLVHHDPAVVTRLTDLGDRLRRAHEDLDAATLRGLSTERRSLVAELAVTAFALVGRGEPSTGLRDEVTATLDAAVADPGVAERVGRLTRAERFSGFGVAVPGSPELTLLRGGKDAAATRDTTAGGSGEKAEPVPSATRRRLARALEKAQSAFDTAESELSGAEEAEHGQAEQVQQVTAELERLHAELDDAKRTLEQRRRAVRSARTRRREARSALDRAERRAGR